MYKIHTVKDNETIEIIAQDLNISPEMLKEINDFSPFYELTVGEQIIVPVVGKTYFETYIVSEGDTIYDIARTHDTSVGDLLALNGLNQDDYIYPNQKLLIPKSNIDFYITKEGDTLKSVVDILQVSLEELFQTNSRVYLVRDQLIVKEKTNNLD